MKRKKVGMPTAVVESYKPSLSVEGPHAKKLHGLKPGAKVKMVVHGVVTDTGISSYNGRKPTARIEVHKISHMPKATKGSSE